MLSGLPVSPPLDDPLERVVLDDEPELPQPAANTSVRAAAATPAAVLRLLDMLSPQCAMCNCGGATRLCRTRGATACAVAYVVSRPVRRRSASRPASGSLSVTGWS